MFNATGPSTNLPKGPIDHLDSEQIKAYFSQWCDARCESLEDFETIGAYYQTISPRSVFFKTCAERESILDMGAGDGSLAIYKEWPAILRPDIDVYGVSLQNIAYANRYKAVAIQNFEPNSNLFPGIIFDAAIAAHFVEHLHRPDQFISWVASRLRPGGRVYLEWPHLISRKMPTRDFFCNRGIPVTTTSFTDDDSHVEAWSMESIVTHAVSAGLCVEIGGRIVLPYVASQFRDLARERSDMTMGTFAVWASIGWAQFLILSKAAAND